MTKSKIRINRQNKKLYFYIHKNNSRFLLAKVINFIFENQVFHCYYYYYYYYSLIIIINNKINKINLIHK